MVVSVDDGIVKRRSNIPEDIQGNVGLDVKELTVLPDALVGKTVDGLMDQLLYIAILRCLYRSIDIEGEGNCRIIELFGADVDRTAALADLHPVFLETWVGKDINKSGFRCIFHKLCGDFFLSGDVFVD
jgi:hypothetical protein